jgi:hypothetical protein
MKIYRYILALGIALIISGYLFAPLKYNWNPEAGTTQVGFSLQNLSNYLIQFQVYNPSAGGYNRHVLEILPNGEYALNINIDVQTRLKIYFCPDGPIKCSELDLPVADTVEASFPLNKTLYLNWDGRELIPQNEGPIPYTTTSGYLLSNNVQQSDYTVMYSPSSTIVYPAETNRTPWEVFPSALEYAKTLRVAEVYTDATVAKLVLGLTGTPSDSEIDWAWQTLSAHWNPDDYPNEPNFARAVMKIINRSRDTLLNPIIKIQNDTYNLR